MTQTREPPKTLHEAIETVKRIVEDTLTSDERYPSIYLFMPDGQLQIVVLNVDGGGRKIARAARIVVYEREPLFAVLQLEGWANNPSTPLDDPDMKRLSVNEITPSDLPEDKRVEIMLVDGESRDGQTETLTWQIERHPDGHRSMREYMPPTTTPDLQMASRFHPLFMTADAFRHLRTSSNSSPELRRVVDQLSDEELYAVVSRLVGVVLAEGGGETTRSWTETMQQTYRQGVHQIAQDVPRE